MFSSSLFKAETPVPSHAKASKSQAGPEMLAAGKKTANEQAEAFGKEYQAVVSEKQNNSRKPVAESVEKTSEQVQVAAASKKSSKGAANSLNENTDSETSASETNGKPGEQISAGQPLDEESGLDSAEKQQIMSDGEALLSRLSESNRQLAEADGQSVASEEQVPEGKILPPENVTEESDMLAAQAVSTEQLADIKQGKTAEDDQTAGLSQEELARVFAPQGSPQVVADGQGETQDGSDASTNAMAALANGNIAALDRAVEAKGTGAAGADLAASERAEGKVGLGAVAPGSFGQPLGGGGLANPEGGSGAVAPQLLAAGESEAQPAGAAAIAAGSAAFSAMEQGIAAEYGMEDGTGEGKVAELSHSMSGLSTLQGQTNAQARTEAALAQSPLQLSKEQAGDQLSERMQMMMSKNLKHVDIRLDPPELGRLQIKLSLNQDQASVQFTVGNQQTRDLVEQAMPRLRELLSQQGLQLAQSSVQQDSPRQQFAGQPNQQHQGQQEGSGSQHHSGSSHGQDSGGGSSEPVDMYVSQPSDRVDYYA